MRQLKYLTLILFLCAASILSAQNYKFFSRPGGDLFDLVTASSIQNDTVYALVQSGSRGGPSRSALYKIPVSDGKPVLIQELDNFWGYQQPENMIIANDILYLAHPDRDSLVYLVDRYRLNDLSLISTELYTVKPKASGFPIGFITSYGEHIIVAGAQNELENGDGDLGFVLWLDKQTMAVDTLMFYDDANSFYNGVDKIGTYEDQLIIVHSAGDHRDFRVKLYNQDMELLSNRKMDSVTRTNLPRHDIFDYVMITNQGEILAAVNGFGYRKFNLEGKVLTEYFDSRIYFNRYKLHRLPLETENGDIILMGEGSIDLNQLVPFIDGQPFTESDVRRSAFATRISNQEEEVWDYSYIEFDEHGNNKMSAIVRMHETADSDLFGFGGGSAVMDSFDATYFIAQGDIWTFRMGADGCIETDSCGANDVFYYLTQLKEVEEAKPSMNIKLYPNPVHDLMNVTVSLDMPVRYRLYNLQGLPIRSGSAYKAFQLSMEGLATGCYVLKVMDGQHEQVLTRLVTKI